ncbi:MAG: polysulfide reductase NrfD [Deltaproteobacteria bacterium]|jgi:formate-dependent nitrite reductase membrane component NrfD|nr:polysulfide reductase NrfD [Deltaproteobacteria bacterium]MBW2534553.1 polysulfide reductase NrfD [Deltaproteobacteria bacterium]
MHEHEVFRRSHLIDPELHVWGWEVPVYLFLGGLAAGVMVLSALLLLRTKRDEASRWLRWLPFAAPVAISLGMGALFLDLEHKAYVWRFYLALKPLSPMSWGSWILVAIYPASLLLGLAMLTDDETAWLAKLRPVAALRLGSALKRVRGWSAERLEWLAWTNVAAGVGLGAYTGLLLGTLAARPAWNSVMLAPLFLVSGVSTGAALMMMFPLRSEEHHFLRRWDVGAIVLELCLLALFLLSLLSGGDEGREAAALFIGGPYTGAFWTLVVFGGLAVPLAMELFESRRKLKPTIMAPALILVGGLTLRWVLVLAGQA